MIYFLTSSPFLPDACLLNPANGQIDHLRRVLAAKCAGVFICSDPDRHDFTDYIANDMRIALEAAGFSFSSWRILDGRNESEAAALVGQAGLIVLAGGHVPTQNAFFQRIGLAKILKGYHGVLLGISAGTMNCCDPVYAQPEEPGEAIDPGYQRFIPGLGVTATMILPHYQKVRDSYVDGLRLFEEITYPDSLGRTFYALPDGSYLLGENGAETIYGEAYRIRDGKMERISGPGEAFRFEVKEA